MLNFKKINYKKVIINAIVIFSIFVLTIVIIRVINHKDKEVVMADLTQNEWEISGIYRDEYGKGHKCKTRMVFLEDGTYFSYDVDVEDKEDQQRYPFKIKSDVFGNLKLYCYQDNRVYKGKIVMKNKTEIEDIGVFDANDEGYTKISAEQIAKEKKEEELEIEADKSIINKFSGRNFQYYSGSGNGEITISFDNDVTKTTNGFKGHCTTYFDDGSGGKRVSYLYSDNKLKINLLSDSEIVGLQDKDIHTKDFIVYDNFLVRKTVKAKDAVISTKGNFDILINDYMKFNVDGTMAIKEYKIGNIVVMKENYYSGTYVRDGNIVIVDSYCQETNHTGKWYLYIDDSGEVYTEVYKLKDNT